MTEIRYIDGFMPLLSTALACLATIRSKIGLLLEGKNIEKVITKKTEGIDLGEKVESQKTEEKPEFKSLFDDLVGGKTAAPLIVQEESSDEEIIIVPRRKK